MIAAERVGPIPVAIDFDGTLATSLWTPENRTTDIGSPIRVNIVKAREVARAGHAIVIYTARDWADEPMLREWLLAQDIPFDGIECSKLLASAYCDDRAIPASAASWLPAR